MNTTTNVIRGDTLAFLRERARLSQARLAASTSGSEQVSVSTIKRIEATGAEGYLANGRVIRQLAKALGQTPEKLALAPGDLSSSETMRPAGYSRLKVDLDGEAAIAMQMVERLYGISERVQVVMAPLFAALLAEGSLAWRRETLAKARAAAAAVHDLGSTHFGYHVGADRIEDAAGIEQESIESRDVFGKLTADHSWNEYQQGATDDRNPFSDYLRSLAVKVPPATIDFDDYLYGDPREEGMPAYRIGRAELEKLAGGDNWAEFALTHGHARVRDIPADLMGDEATAKRVAWLSDKVPPEVKAEIEALILDL